MKYTRRGCEGNLLRQSNAYCIDCFENLYGARSTALELEKFSRILRGKLGDDRVSTSGLIHGYMQATVVGCDTTLGG